VHRFSLSSNFIVPTPQERVYFLMVFPSNHTELRKRLLFIAEAVTVGPSIVRRIKMKLEDEGEESLSRREKAILNRARKVHDRLTSGNIDPTSETMPAPDKKKNYEHFREALEEAGIEVDRMSVPDMIDLVKKSVEKDPLTSSDPVRKTMGSISKFRKLLLVQKMGLPAAIKDLSEANDENMRNTASKLKPLVSSILGPVSLLTDQLQDIFDMLDGIDGRDTKVIRKAYSMLKEVESTYRNYGSDINEQLAPIKNKHERAAQEITKVLRVRYKDAMQEMREKGASPEQAAEGAMSLPVIRKLKSQAETMKALASGVDFVLQEFSHRFVESMKSFKELKSDFSSLLDKNVSKVAFVPSLSERLRKVSKTLVTLRYLYNTSH